MNRIIHQSSAGEMGRSVWLVEQDPTRGCHDRLVRFMRRTSQRKTLDQIAEWLPRDPAAVPCGGVWNHRRWVPKSPTVPQWLLEKVEAHMRQLDVAS